MFKIRKIHGYPRRKIVDFIGCVVSNKITNNKGAFVSDNSRCYLGQLVIFPLFLVLFIESLGISFPVLERSLRGGLNAN